jgi:hypothetical protein
MAVCEMKSASTRSETEIDRVERWILFIFQVFLFRPVASALAGGKIFFFAGAAKSSNAGAFWGRSELLAPKHRGVLPWNGSFNALRGADTYLGTRRATLKSNQELGKDSISRSSIS